MSKRVSLSDEKYFMTSIENFEMVKEVGSGNYGTVHLCRDKRNDQLVAIKMIDRSLFERDPRMEMWMQREIENHLQLRHPNIIQMFEMFTSDTNVYVTLEYAEKGDIYELMCTLPENRFPEDRGATYIRDIAMALQYCHGLGIIHRDVKPENILLTADGNVKLSDFGFSVQLVYDSENKRKKRSTFCGTINYLAPEIVKNDFHDHNVDIWCLSVLMFEFLTGTLPFTASSSLGIFQNIKVGWVSYPFHLSADSKDLMRKMFMANPEQRLPLDQLMVHPWIVKNARQATDFL